MKDLNLSISQEGIRLLKEMIGQELVSVRYAKFGSGNIVFQKVELTTPHGKYLIDNDVGWFEDFCSGPDDLPCLSFKKLPDGENPFARRSSEEIITDGIGEKITDILIIQDEATVFDGEKYLQKMESSGGIILVMDKAQYGFFKENMWLDEELVLYKGRNAMDGIESLKDHFDIFGYPFRAKCKRVVLSLKDGTEREVERAEEIGERPEEEIG